MNSYKKRIPLTVVKEKEDSYLQNYEQATKGTGRLFLFAGDQKFEHLNKDFYGEGIPKENATPEHLFDIASKAPIGVFATQLGLISRYGRDYEDINYIVKLNSKTNIIPTKQRDPMSLLINSVEQVIQFKRASGLPILGIGYTIYLGSEYESEMLIEAANSIYQAHQHGLLALLWIYPRGKAVSNEVDPDIIAGAAGVAACLGADFVKLNPPAGKTTDKQAELLRQAVLAAGRTKVVCSGGAKRGENEFLQELADQISIGGTAGCAVGRNIHQRTEADALALCQKIAKIIFE